MSEWTNGKPFVVTAEQMKLPWCGNRSGKYFRCGFCGHRFKEGDTVCWVFTNNIPGAGGNPFSCADCGTDLRELRNKWIKMAADWKDMIDGKFWNFAKNFRATCEQEREW